MFSACSLFSVGILHRVLDILNENKNPALMRYVNEHQGAIHIIYWVMHPCTLNLRPPPKLDYCYRYSSHFDNCISLWLKKSMQFQFFPWINGRLETNNIIVTRHHYVTSFLSQNSWLMLLVLLHLLKTRNKSYFDFNDNVTIPC